MKIDVYSNIAVNSNLVINYSLSVVKSEQSTVVVYLPGSEQTTPSLPKMVIKESEVW